jgi:activator of HSP90 ATPase
MESHFLTRREVSVRLVSVLSAMGFAGKAGAVTRALPFSGSDEISRTCECIHQEVAFRASRARVYQALTDPKQFGKVVDLSFPGAGASAAISGEVGGAFSLFGGVIVGRHIEMVPNERLVQAWRSKDWDPGVFSIAKFQLNEEGSGTKLVFDHTGFPHGAADDLAEGWKSHYWEALQKILA